MDVTELLSQVTGPLGALVVLALVVVSLIKWRLITPGWILEQAEKRIAILDKDNATLSKTIQTLIEQDAEHRVSIARLEGQIGHMTEQISGLRAEISRLRAGDKR